MEIEVENSAYFTEEELIAMANNHSMNYVEVDNAARAIERLYCVGDFDDVVGVEGSEPESAVLYNNWILWTDSQGNIEADNYKSNEKASEVFDDYCCQIYGDFQEDY